MVAIHFCLQERTTSLQNDPSQCICCVKVYGVISTKVWRLQVQIEVPLYTYKTLAAHNTRIPVDANLRCDAMCVYYLFMTVHDKWYSCTSISAYIDSYTHHHVNTCTECHVFKSHLRQHWKCLLWVIFCVAATVALDYSEC